jgi:zinc transporter ZupT
MALPALARTLALFLLPLVLLAAVILLFLRTEGAGLKARPAAPIESLDFERSVLRPGAIELHVRNTGPGELRIAQLAVKDMIVPFEAEPGPALPRLGRAVLTIAYPWVEAEPYTLRLFTANSIAFTTSIASASATRGFDLSSLASFTLIGFYVGVIPVFLGIFWFPALRKLGQGAFFWLMGLTVGLLLFLGIDATSEALEKASGLGPPFQGVGLVGIGIVGSFLFLDALSRRKALSQGDEAAGKRRAALLISVGIGLHNLGEGLAIGSAFSVGATGLGSFFVIGFIVQNITEGLGIVAPLVRQRPSPRLLAGLGLIGGGPAILGAWIGGLAYTPALATLFLALGAGAVLEVAYEIHAFIRSGTAKKPMPMRVFGGVMTGMTALYLTGLMIK